MSRVLDGQVAIVTGAGRGFGSAIARGLAAEGVKVTVTARTQTQLDETADLIETAGGEALALCGDVTDAGDVNRIVQAARDRFGPVTLLVNNAGIPDPFGPIGNLDPERWWYAQRIHILAPFLYINKVIPQMIAAGGGRIINVSAKGGRIAAPNLSAYCLGKAAQIRLTELIAVENRGRNIFVFAIDPGFVITSLAEDTMNSPDAQQWLPDMVKRLKARKAADAPKADLDRCAKRCIDLASGKHDGLSGCYMELDDDLEAMLSEATARRTEA